MKNSKEDIKKLIAQELKKLEPTAKAILFGSQARGDASSNSDWDILILLDKAKITTADYDNIAYPLFELGWQIDQHFSVKLYTEKDWEKRSFSPFYKNVNKEGIQLWA